MIGTWEFSEYMLVLGFILMTVSIVIYVYRVFICKDVLLKTEGRRTLASFVLLGIFLLIFVMFVRAITDEITTIWLGFPLFLISLLVTLLLLWAFGELRTAEERAMSLLEAMVGVIEAGDPNLEGHSIHVRNLTMLLYDSLPLGLRLKINPHNLEMAALLLDVGKLGVPRSIINKAGKLEPEEWDFIRRHPEIAVKILQSIKSFDTISLWIKYHHERVDGGGYYHLRNEQIPLASRLIAVADTYSAITMERSYKATMPHEDALAELRQAAGSQLDSMIVEIFCHIPYKKIEQSLIDVKQRMQRYDEENFR